MIIKINIYRILKLMFHVKQFVLFVNEVAECKCVFIIRNVNIKMLTFLLKTKIIMFFMSCEVCCQLLLIIFEVFATLGLFWGMFHVKHINGLFLIGLLIDFFEIDSKINVI